MKKLQPALLVSIFLLSGCASISETFNSKNSGNESAHGTYGYESKIYVGVRKDLNSIGACCYFMACICAPIGLIDMPFSFVADTLFLPYTIADKMRNNSKHARCIENKRKKTLEAQKNGERWKDDDTWCKKAY